MLKKLTFTLNGKRVRLKVRPERPLLWVLRADLGLTGTKFGCGEGLCGACVVLVDDEPVRSCQTAVSEVSGRRVLTIEGLARESALHPVQQAFLEQQAVQCGFCTPGMILTAYALLLRNSRPSVAQITEALEGNLCRCGAHTRIIAAIQKAAAAGKEGRS